MASQIFSCRLARATEQLTGTRPAAEPPALLGIGYLAHAGTQLPPPADFVRSANGLSSHGNPGLNLVLPSSLQVSPTAYFMSVRTCCMRSMVEQAAEVVATRQAMINAVYPVSGLRAVEWHPKLIYAAGSRTALGLAPGSLRHIIDVLLASFHGVLRRAPSAPKLLLMTPHNDTYTSLCRHLVGGRITDEWPDSLQDVLLAHLLIARTPLLVPPHEPKEKAKVTADAIDARFAQCLAQLPNLEAADREQLLVQLTPDKVAALRRSQPTLFHQFLECTNTVKATGMTGNVSLVIIGKDTSFLYYGAEAEARFNVSLTRAKALTVVAAPPSSTGPLGMLQTASSRLYLRTGSGLEDLSETAWRSAH